MTDYVQEIRDIADYMKIDATIEYRGDMPSTDGAVIILPTNIKNEPPSVVAFLLAHEYYHIQQQHIQARRQFFHNGEIIVTPQFKDIMHQQEYDADAFASKECQRHGFFNPAGVYATIKRYQHGNDKEESILHPALIKRIERISDYLNANT